MLLVDLQNCSQSSFKSGHPNSGQSTLRVVLPIMVGFAVGFKEGKTVEITEFGYAVGALLGAGDGFNAHTSGTCIGLISWITSTLTQRTINGIPPHNPLCNGNLDGIRQTTFSLKLQMNRMW